jgi:capsular exopolysaccharide synthesis family protein
MDNNYKVFKSETTDYQNQSLDTVDKSLVPVCAETPERLFIPGSSRKYEDLRIKLFTSFPDDDLKTLLFAATSHGSGCSTTAVGFASGLVKDFKLQVLLVDANMRTPKFHQLFEINKIQTIFDVATRRGRNQSKVESVGYGKLYVTTFFGDSSNTVNLFETHRFKQFLETASKSFDYIILDGPPIPNSSESRIISSKVDGVILVLEAGVTRRQVALRAKKEIEGAGGRLLGVVLNKRKYHIPKWVYKFL